MQKANMLEEIGRKRLFIHHILALLVSLETIIHYWTTIGVEKAPTQVTRFCLTIGLLAWIHSGSKAAKIIAIILFWLGGFGMVSLAIKIYKEDPTWGMSVGINGLIYLLYARALIWSKPINAFLQAQREG